MLLAGFGVAPPVASVDAETFTYTNQLIVQQCKTTDLDGNLRTVYPSKTDLQFEETVSIIVDRE